MKRRTEKGRASENGGAECPHQLTLVHSPCSRRGVSLAATLIASSCRAQTLDHSLSCSSLLTAHFPTPWLRLVVHPQETPLLSYRTTVNANCSVSQLTSPANSASHAQQKHQHGSCTHVQQHVCPLQANALENRLGEPPWSTTVRASALRTIVSRTIGHNGASRSTTPLIGFIEQLTGTAKQVVAVQHSSGVVLFILVVAA